MSKAITTVLLALLLCSCSDKLDSLKAELAVGVEKLRGTTPLPIPGPVRLAPELRYEAGKLPDPFYPERR